jgi:hypothetical protein
MVAIYLGALVAVTLSQYRLAMQTQYPRLAICAAVVLAAGLGPALTIVSFTPFVAQVGIQYWFLAGALHGVACRYGVHDR